MTKKVKYEIQVLMKLLAILLSAVAASAGAAGLPTTLHCTARLQRTYLAPSSILDSTGAKVGRCGGTDTQEARLSACDEVQLMVESELQPLDLKLLPSTNPREADFGIFRARG